MGSNEQTELTRKIETLRKQADDSGGAGCGVEASSKTEKGPMDTDNSVVIAGGRWGEGRVEVEEDIRGINGNTKSTITKTNKSVDKNIGLCNNTNNVINETSIY